MSETHRPARSGIDRDQFEAEWRRRRDNTDDDAGDDTGDGEPVDDTAADQSDGPSVLIDDITVLDTPVVAEATASFVPQVSSPDADDEPITSALSGSQKPGGVLEFDDADQPLLWDVFEAAEDLAEAAGELIDAAGQKVAEVVDAGMGSVWDSGDSGEPDESGNESDGGDGGGSDDGGSGGDSVSGGGLEGSGGGGSISGQSQMLPTDTFEPVVQIDLNDTGYDQAGTAAAGFDDSPGLIDDLGGLGDDLGGGA